ncbi:MAG: metal-dependent hydrolase [Saprospiraceae bacterium]
MDSLTHLAIGACMGEVFAGKKLGNKSLLWGALAQSIPDIDFLGSLWLDTPSSLLAHRGFTHSILFVVLISLLFASLANHWHRPHNISFKRWLIFFGLVIGAHIFIDAFNNYGVGWLEPFNHTRISFNAIYVADPFFSIWPALGLIYILYNRFAFKKNYRAAVLTLGLSFCYLGYCLLNKSFIDHSVKRSMKSQNIVYKDYFTTPSPLQSWLWYIVAKVDSGYQVGFRSIFDSDNHVDFEYFPQNDSLLKFSSEHVEVDKLKLFSKGYYTVENWGDTLVFNDLRFGQMVGWQDPHQKFVFHYFLNHKADNTLVVQRGRFKYWDLNVAKNLVVRIFKH